MSRPSTYIPVAAAKACAVDPDTALRLASTGRGPLEYLEVGSGPPVLSLHGAMGGWDQGLLLARTVGPPELRYLCPSRPGYLGTPAASGTTPEEQADLLAALLDSLSLPAAGVMAISGGGPAALHFAARHPDRCSFLVLISTLAGPMAKRPPLSFRILTFLIGHTPLGGWLERRPPADPHRAAARSIPDAELRRRTLEHPHAGPLCKALLASTSQGMRQRLAGTAADIRTGASASMPLERIGCPTLVVHGSDDELLPLAEHGRRLAAGIGGAELLEVAGGRHMTIFTHNDPVRERVAAFLSRVAGH